MTREFPIMNGMPEKYSGKIIFAAYSKSITFASLIRGVAQLASALAWGARGRKFESSHPDLQKRVSACIYDRCAFLFLSGKILAIKI